MSDVETFESGAWIEVPPGKIESELSRLWREAAAHDKKPVTRACLWNFIISCAGDADFKYSKQLIDDLSQRVPARVIVVRAEAGGSESLKAWVEANWRRDEHGSSGSDEVTLQTTGASATRLPSLVRSLTITDSPTAMMWVGDLPDEKAPVCELLKECDRLVVDTRKLPTEKQLVTLAQIKDAHPDLELVDLSWLGISPLRGLCAALFDPPHDPTPLGRLDRVRVTSGIKGAQTRALIALGWLGARLGWRDYRRVDSQSEIRAWQANRKDGSAIMLELATEGGDAAHGVTGLQLFCGNDEWALTRDQKNIDVKSPDLPPRVQPARSHSDSELTVSALGPRGRDAVYPIALTHASWLVQS